MNVTILFGVVTCYAAGLAADGAQVKHAFFAMDTGTKDADHATIDAQLALIKKLGYDGIGYTGCREIPALLQAADKYGIAVSTIYVSASVEPGKRTYEDGLAEAIALLEGRGTVVWLTISSKTYKPSEEAGDAQAVELVREVGETAAKSGLRVALYPHTGCWLERVDDALRIANKVNMPNVGATFNLCHWLNAEKGKDLESLLKRVLPRLFVVTINGADTEGGWDRLIQTLDRGTYDVRSVVKLLNELGYTGPIGLQGYGIPGSVEDNLTRSIRAWKALRPG
jgi:sugar phosphate isomerase/epimerase